MKQPDPARGPLRRALAAAGLLSVLPAIAHAQQTGPEETQPEAADTSDWYRVEVLVFAREDADAFAAERWNPLPALSYPQEYRYLIDSTLADTRAGTDSYRSSFDALGIQRVVLPRPVHGLESVWRPDARLSPPLIDFLPEPAPQPTADLTVAEAGPGEPEVDPQPGTPAIAESVAAADEAAEAPLLALLHKLLPSAALEFRQQARQLRRQGSSVLFHGAWWTILSDDATPVTVALDRAADRPVEDWPALQGSVRVYRSRYLHAEVNLWLNTQGEYLPPEWRIPAPPRLQPSFRQELLDGSVPDPEAQALTLEDLLPPPPQETLPEPLDTRNFELAAGSPSAEDSYAAESGAVNAALSEPGGGLSPPLERAGGAKAEPEEAMAEPWPYRHAIVHRQSARMRGSEIHYLDHPVLGVVVRVTPAGEDNLPTETLEDIPWRERHGFPVDRLPVVLEADTLED